MTTQAFQPQGSTVKISANASSQRAQITPPGYGGTVQVYNAGSIIVYVKQGADNTVVAATTDTPVPPGAVLLFDLPASTAYVAAIGAAAGPADVYFTPGMGG